jgi:hypothetical protein
LQSSPTSHRDSHRNPQPHLVVELLPGISECVEEMVFALTVELHSHIVECYEYILGTGRKQRRTEDVNCEEME